MEATELKQAWVTAYKITLRQYKEDRHSCLNCAKCDIDGLIGEADCHYCLENNAIEDFAEECMDRQCRSFNSLNRFGNVSMYNILYQSAVIEYHEKAITYLKTVLPITFVKHKNNITKHLKEIDKRVAEEFNL